ncbi:hypothetical protein AB0K00_57485 [Dactylosporangium sp. NPDC049525]|uniref:hypothetical protein n=1 Tax=Dactylosporangium sp. NPDC049525 TaxID=3154730 RepID=UPI0034269B4C
MTMSNQSPEWSNAIGEMLLRELRCAVAARLEEGVEAEAVAVDLTNRIRRVRAMRAGPAGWPDDGAAP